MNKRWALQRWPLKPGLLITAEWERLKNGQSKYISTYTTKYGMNLFRSWRRFALSGYSLALYTMEARKRCSMTYLRPAKLIRDARWPVNIIILRWSRCYHEAYLMTAFTASLCNRRQDVALHVKPHWSGASPRDGSQLFSDDNGGKTPHRLRSRTDSSQPVSGVIRFLPHAKHHHHHHHQQRRGNVFGGVCLSVCLYVRL